VSGLIVKADMGDLRRLEERLRKEMDVLLERIAKLEAELKELREAVKK
jgi:cell division protein FtsB